MSVKFKIYVEYRGIHMGWIDKNGAIGIAPDITHRPYIFVCVLLHELIHWVCDAWYTGEITHYYNDLIYCKFGPYPGGMTKIGRLNIWRDMCRHYYPNKKPPL